VGGDDYKERYNHRDGPGDSREEAWSQYFPTPNSAANSSTMGKTIMVLQLKYSRINRMDNTDVVDAIKALILTPESCMDWVKAASSQGHEVEIHNHSQV